MNEVIIAISKVKLLKKIKIDIVKKITTGLKIITMQQYLKNLNPRKQKYKILLNANNNAVKKKGYKLRLKFFLYGEKK